LLSIFAKNKKSRINEGFLQAECGVLMKFKGRILDKKKQKEISNEISLQRRPERLRLAKILLKCSRVYQCQNEFNSTWLNLFSNSS